MLREQIEDLQVENRRLTANLARSCSKGTRGGGARTERLQAAQRRVLECARFAHALEGSNADLRRRLEGMERRRRTLEERVLRQRGSLETLRLSEHCPDDSRRCDVRARTMRHSACAKLRLAKQAGIAPDAACFSSQRTASPQLSHSHSQIAQIDECGATIGDPS